MLQLSFSDQTKKHTKLACFYRISLILMKGINNGKTQYSVDTNKIEGSYCACLANEEGVVIDFVCNQSPVVFIR